MEGFKQQNLPKELLVRASNDAAVLSRVEIKKYGINQLGEERAKTALLS